MIMSMDVAIIVFAVFLRFIIVEIACRPIAAVAIISIAMKDAREHQAKEFAIVVSNRSR